MFEPKPFTLYESTNKNKKFDVYVPKGNKLKKVSFGAKGMDDYTTYYRKDPELAKERRRLYRLRHARDKLNDPYSAGFWSMWVLWEKSNLGESFDYAVNKAKKILNSE